MNTEDDTPETPTRTTRRLVAALLAAITVTIVICSTVLIANGHDVPGEFTLAIGTAIGALGALVAGVKDGA